MSVSSVNVNAVDSSSGAWWISAGTSQESRSAEAPVASATPQAVKAAVSPMARMLAKLDTLVKSDPQKFADVTSAIASQLAAAAKGTSGGDADFLARQAEQFEAAARSRDVSSLQPRPATARGYAPSSADPSEAVRRVMDQVSATVVGA